MFSLDPCFTDFFFSFYFTGVLCQIKHIKNGPFRSLFRCRNLSKYVSLIRPQILCYELLSLIQTYDGDERFDERVGNSTNQEHPKINRYNKCIICINSKLY